MFGVEPAGEGIASGRHGVTIGTGVPGILHGQRTLVLADDDGQIFPAHSISAGLDYPGVGPEHAFLHETGRAQYVSVTDEEALEAFQHLARIEGLLPALESAHAIAYLPRLARELPKGALVVVNLSGRGDKDAPQVREILKSRSAQRSGD
jgi:tryptophan synthase beta chain